MNKIYLDNAATTRLSGEVLKEMLPYYTDVFGNSASLHSFGREASKAVDHARDMIASYINAKSSEIIFTSGGTESNNFAIKGVALANQNKGKHIIVSAIEHHSVLDSCKELEQLGFEITYLPVNEFGLVEVADLIHEIRKDTILVSIMAVNNEVGTIQNIKTIGSIVKDYKNCVFHCDAVQALPVLKMDVMDMGIHLMSLSSHKIHGPKGVGALYVRKGVPLVKLIQGGEQEFNRRGGTQNVPGIVGFGKAVELLDKELKQITKKLNELSSYFVKKLQFELPEVTINGHSKQKAPGIVNVTFHYVDGESILIMLDLEGIAVSTGSACTAGVVKKSHVLMAMGKSDDDVTSSVRFSFGIDNTKEEIDHVVRTLTNIVENMRAKSPLYTKNGKKVGMKNV